jgi:predicted DsbA family dithiol-disulfide isomerase
MNPATAPQTLVDVDIISDVMCPWCFIGKRRFEEALALLPSTVAVTVHWRPFQLDPSLPASGKDRKTYLENKFGSAARAAELYQNVSNAGTAVGIDFKFDAIAVSPNTLDAHRLIRWAQSAGHGMQDDIVEALFQAYFIDGRNIGDIEILIDIASSHGMDAKLVRELMESDADRDEVSREVAVAGQMGVTGVPCFVVENRYAVMGAQDPAVIANALTEVAKLKQAGTLPDPQ